MLSHKLGNYSSVQDIGFAGLREVKRKEELTLSVWTQKLVTIQRRLTYEASLKTSSFCDVEAGAGLEPATFDL